MNKQLIYITEDDEGIGEVYLGAFADAYEVEIFPDGKSFFAAMENKQPDLVILDIMLPDMDGFTILTEIRKKDEKLPVIIVSAKNDELSFVKGLNKGADDYMSKPFSVLELLARVRANLRRSNPPSIKVGNITINSNTYTAYVNEQKLELTLKEFSLLRYLAEKVGVTVEREKLFEKVWGEDFMGETRTLDMHVASLREKLFKANADGLIITVRGVGYRLECSK